MALRTPDRSGALRHLTPAWKTRAESGKAPDVLDAASLLAGGTGMDVRVSCTAQCGGDDMPIDEFDLAELEAAISRVRAIGQPQERWRLTACCIKCAKAAASEAEEKRLEEEARAKQEREQKLTELGVSSFNEKENDKLNASHPCWACKKTLPASAFSRKMLTKPPGKRRCQGCTEAALAAEEAKRAAAKG
mmetsp:Transcript_9636/g.10804  ORF Transcript_9636/g.10804 Transcript_9636/m.10804 type:complete len:191 (+) Transcript_9636:47-619(+)